jgi:hypothetical protein
MTLRMVVLSQAAVTLAAVALIAGCTGGSGAGSGAGGTGSTPDPSASVHANEVTALRAAAACLRSHGYPSFPDPVQDARGNWGWGPGVPRRVNATVCDDMIKHAKSLSRPQDQERVSAADLVKLRQYSACMRQHGVADWPDPTTVGGFKLPASLEQKRRTAPFRAAERACDPLLKGADVKIEHLAVSSR